jgi:hypothetical protein
MGNHDPRRLVEGLRDHLARHDQKVILLFGAGTSSAVQVDDDQGSRPLIPNLRDMTQACADRVTALGNVFSDAWDAVGDECEANGDDRLVESILTRVRLKLAAIGGDDRLVGLDATQLSTLEETIRTTIAELVQPAEDVIPIDLPHSRFARWIAKTDRQHGVEVFTTNYDVLLERSFEDQWLLTFDGFVGGYKPFFAAETLVRDVIPSSPWTRLWKMHGSVTWQLEEGRIVRGSPSLSGELILPSSYKYEESRKQPYLAMLDRLARILRAGNVVMITCGYSFSDEHINALIFDAIREQPRTHVFALQHTDPPDEGDLMEAALRLPNLVVVGRKRGCIRGETGDWKLEVPIDSSVAPLLEHAFDSDAAPEESSGALTGQLRLGDFIRFARFLDSMVDDVSPQSSR